MKKTKITFRFLKLVLRLVISVLLLFFFLLLFLRSNWGQQILVKKAINYVTNKTNTKIQVEKLYLTFGGNLKVKNLYAADTKGDTLLFTKSLVANLPLLKLINGTAFGVESLTVDELTVNATRKDTIAGFNFQFFIDAFASEKANKRPKDTSQTSPKIILKNLDIQKAKVVFNDATLGIESSYQIGKLSGGMDILDPDSMQYFTDNIRLENAVIKVKIETTNSSNKNTENGDLPNLSFQSILVKNTIVDYSTPTENYKLDLDSLYTQIPKVDLNNLVYNVAIFEMNNSAIHLGSTTDKLIDEANTETQKKTKKILPDFEMVLKNINLKNNAISYTVNSSKPTPNIFNPNAIRIKNLQFHSDEITYNKKKATLNLAHFSFKEISGFYLRKLAVNTQIDSTNLSINSIQVVTNKSDLKGNVQISYSNLDNLINLNKNVTVNTEIENYSVNVKDFFVFNKSFQKNENLKKLSKKNISGNLYANGNLKQLFLNNLTIGLSEKTKANLSGKVENLTDLDSFSATLEKIDIVLFKDDFRMLLNEKELGLNLPKTIHISGIASSSLNNSLVNLKVKTSQGNAAIKGSYKNKKEQSYQVDVLLDKYRLGELLQQKKLQTISLALNANAKGTNLKTIDANLQTTIQKLELENYTLEDLKITGKLTDGKGELTSAYRDENINIKIKSRVTLDATHTKASADINLIGANLKALGLMPRNVKTAMDIRATFTGNTEQYQIDSSISDGIFVYDNRTYLLGNVAANAFINRDTTAFSVQNRLIDVKLASNTDPKKLYTSIQKHISSYFNKQTVLDTLHNPVSLQLRGKVAQAPILNEVFLLNVKDLDTINFSVDFFEKKAALNANLTLPHLKYSNFEVDSLALNINTNQKDIEFDLGFKNINAKPFNIPRTKLYGTQKNDTLAVTLSATKNDKKIIHMNSFIIGNRDSLQLSVNHKNFIVNGKNWQVPYNNKVLFANEQLTFANFNFKYKDQQICLANDLKKIANKHVAVTYENFKLKEIFSYLNPEQQLVKGIVNGKFIVENPFKNLGVLTDTKISNLELMNTNFGTLVLNAKSIDKNHYNFSTSINGGVTDLNAQVAYSVGDNDSKINGNLNIERFDMKGLETLSFGEIRNASGIFKADFSISNYISNPQYEGVVHFTRASFKPKKLNTQFTLTKEKLIANNNGLQLDNFTVLDEKNNKLSLSGEISTKEITNPKFNLNLKAKDFKILDAKKEDNANFYGKASFGATAKLTGDLKIPKIDATVTIGKDTDFYYVMPATYAAIKERDNVVIFVNKKNPAAIISQREKQTAVVTGFDIKAKIKTTKEATFTVITDKNTGDNFKIAGDSNLNMGVNPKGDLSIFGNFIADKGSYELNLYNLVNRKFSLVKGSKVSWFGNPFNAKLDVKARYTVVTSAAALMASKISGEDATTTNQFKQQFPFWVDLNINGELMQPAISFSLDMPEQEQGALKGKVYARLQEVNNQEEEVNKQVFSLLALNRFYPTSGSDGSSGGFATVVKNNVNDAIASQLNTFSSRVLGDSGVNLDFGLNSFTDYQDGGSIIRTQLEVAAEKKLFNDRFTVRVGSEIDVQGTNQREQNTPLIGNVSLMYQLTEDGRYQLRGFRTSEFENVIDGQTIVSGISLIFNKEFNQFNELWYSLFSKEKKKNQKK